MVWNPFEIRCIKATFPALLSCQSMCGKCSLDRPVSTIDNAFVVVVSPDFVHCSLRALNDYRAGRYFEIREPILRG